MRLNHCGINTAHEGDFRIDRPCGSNDYLFVYTKTPFIISVNGSVRRCGAGTAVLFSKGSPQHYMADGQFFKNDFLHFNTDGDDDEAYIGSLPLVYDAPFSSTGCAVPLDILKYISLEYMNGGESLDVATDLLLKYFLLKLSQAMRESATQMPDSAIRRDMNELRAEIYNNAAVNWTVAGLAARMNLSQSYFQATYKRIFGRSCIADVIYSKNEHAKYLLTSTDYAVSRVAQLCGYENDTHFSRQFKKLNGMTATEYRRGKGQR